MADRGVVIAGAGVAGLTAALSFAAKGFSVTVLERAGRLDEAGAGLQLSPNATRILRSLGVLDRLLDDAVRPDAILLKDATDLAPLARVPLGKMAEQRWGAPYLVAHRADLQRALLERVRQTPAITLTTGAEVLGATFEPQGVTVQVKEEETERQVACNLLIGADGVWSKLRGLTGGGKSRFTGHIAFRAILHREALDRQAGIVSPDTVTAFLAPGFHLVAYPLRGGSQINLVAVTRGKDLDRRWTNDAEMAQLAAATARAAPALSALISAARPWSAWPIHAVEGPRRWTRPGGLALIGDAAHALTPYAAQGAAMAIEDAALLAELAAQGDDTAATLSKFERLRQPRIARVARRGSFNRLAWHAAGPIALARNLVLRLKTEHSLAADLDWLYGYDAAGAASRA